MRGSFGLTPEHATQLYEQFFLMKYHGGWSFYEAYNLPIQVRNWFMKRLQKQFENEKAEMDKISKKKGG